MAMADTRSAEKDHQAADDTGNLYGQERIQGLPSEASKYGQASGQEESGTEARERNTQLDPPLGEENEAADDDKKQQGLWKHHERLVDSR